MKIGLDLDGVVYDFTESLRYYVVTHKGLVREKLTDAQCWDFFTHQWGWTLQEFLSHAAEGVDAGVIFKYGEPLPGSLEGIQALRDSGHTIHVVTDRKFGNLSKHNTVEWLDQFNIQYESITFAADKTVLDLDVFIDDRDKNYWDLTEVGKRCLLFNQPWNSHVETEDRVNSWDEVVEKLVNR